MILSQMTIMDLKEINKTSNQVQNMFEEIWEEIR